MDRNVFFKIGSETYITSASVLPAKRTDPTVPISGFLPSILGDQSPPVQTIYDILNSVGNPKINAMLGQVLTENIIPVQQYRSEYSKKLDQFVWDNIVSRIVSKYQSIIQNNKCVEFEVKYKPRALSIETAVKIRIYWYYLKVLKRTEKTPTLYNIESFVSFINSLQISEDPLVAYTIGQACNTKQSDEIWFIYNGDNAEQRVNGQRFVSQALQKERQKPRCIEIASSLSPSQPQQPGSSLLSPNKSSIQQEGPGPYVDLKLQSKIIEMLTITRNELTQTKKQLVDCNARCSQSSNENILQQVTELRRRVDDLTNLKNALKESNAEVKNTSKPVDGLQKQFEICHQNYKQVEAEKIALQTELTNTRDKINELKLTHSQASNPDDRTGLETNIQQESDKEKLLKDKIISCDSNLKNKETELENVKTQLKNINEQLSKQGSEVDSKLAEYQEKLSACDKKNAVQKRWSNLALKSCRQRFESINKDLNEAKANIINLTDKLKDTKAIGNDCSDIQNQLDEALDSKGKLEKQIQILQSKLVEGQSPLAIVEGQSAGIVEDQSPIANVGDTEKGQSQSAGVVEGQSAGIVEDQSPIANVGDTEKDQSQSSDRVVDQSAGIVEAENKLISINQHPIDLKIPVVVVTALSKRMNSIPPNLISRYNIEPGISRGDCLAKRTKFDKIADCRIDNNEWKLSKPAMLLYHPDRNPNCKEYANYLFTKYNEECQQRQVSIESAPQYPLEIEDSLEPVNKSVYDNVEPVNEIDKLTSIDTEVSSESSTPIDTEVSSELSTPTDQSEISSDSSLPSPTQSLDGESVTEMVANLPDDARIKELMLERENSINLADRDVYQSRAVANENLAKRRAKRQQQRNISTPDELTNITQELTSGVENITKSPGAQDHIPKLILFGHGGGRGRSTDAPDKHIQIEKEKQYQARATEKARQETVTLERKRRAQISKDFARVQKQAQNEGIPIQPAPTRRQKNTSRQSGPGPTHRQKNTSRQSGPVPWR